MFTWCCYSKYTTYVAAEGLTSAWLYGGGENTTNNELS